MSEPTPRPPSTSHPTRQQLDELDALMQRMLALPVNQQPDEAEAPASEPSADVAFADNSDSRLANSWESVATTTAVSLPERPVETPAPPPVPVHHPVVAPRLRKPLEVRPRPPRLLASWLLAPLVWTNRSFDRGAAYLGRPGRWFCSPTGRNVLGWLGIACMAAAAAWVIIELNWTW